MTYLTREVLAEGFTRNLNMFTRFLEIISFSQAQGLTMSNLASDGGVNAKLIAAYVSLLEQKGKTQDSGSSKIFFV
jgi:predicted transcriptional regulator